MEAGTRAGGTVSVEVRQSNSAQDFFAGLTTKNELQKYGGEGGIQYRPLRGSHGDDYC